MLRAEPPATLAVTGRNRAVWPERVLATVGLLVLLLGFRSVVDGADWYVSTALVTVLVATVVVVLRMVGLRRLVTPVALLAELIVLSWVFVPSTLLVLVPTWSTVGGFRELVERAGPIIVQEQAPVAASSSIVLVLAASFGALVIVADLLLQWRHGVPLVGALLLAVFVSPGLITGTSPSVWLFLAAAVLWLVLLRGRTAVDGPARSARQMPAVVLGVGGLVAALLFPVVSPDIGSVAASWGKPPPQVFGRGINPMIELGTNLRRNSPVVVASLTTDLDDPPYLKVATLPNFTGKTWRPSASFGRGRFEGRLAIDDDIEASAKTTQITIRQLRSDLLPVPYPTVDIRGLDGGFRVERTGLTVETNDEDNRGQTYTTTSLDVQPTAEQLRAADPRVAPDFRQYLELGEMPDIITETAREVTADATTNYDRAIALQNFFRSGDFEYSETAPVAEDYDGNGLAVLAKFLQRKAGYCVHFSSGMAVMARSLGIPSRIAVGYAPGSPGDFVDGERTYDVMSDDLHAWTELYFDGAGWVRFDPTPGIGQGTAFTEPTTGQTPGDTATETPEAAPEGAQQSPRTDENTTATATSDEASSTAPRSAAAVLVGMLAIVLAPGAVRRIRRWWRWRAADRSFDPAWREVEDTARDFGVLTSTADTPRGFALRLRERPGVDTEALDRLLGLVERSRFSRAGADGAAVDDARLVVASLAQGAGRRQRWRAALLPRSFGPRAVAIEPPPEPSPAT